MPDIIIPLPEAKITDENEKVLPVIPLHQSVVFPSTEVILGFGKEKSKRALEQAFTSTNRRLVIVMQKGTNNGDPKEEVLEKVGVLCEVDRFLPLDQEVNALVRGLKRIKINEYVTFDPYVTARITEVTDVKEEDNEVAALMNNIINQYKKLVAGKQVDFLNFMNIMSSVTPEKVADQVASSLNLKPKDKQDLIETFSIKDRLKKVLAFLTEEVKILEIEKNISFKVQEKFDKNYKETILREKVKAIEKELGEEPESREIKEIKDKIKAAKMPSEVEEKVLKELRKLEQMSPMNPESGYIRNYIDVISDLPWSAETPNHKDIKKAGAILNEDHYGLDKIKERILEYLAVMKLKSEKKKDLKTPTILCFIGPPGVGKTSIGKSIARALGRKFVKISLGGIRDEAEIRGHRRTYVGAMPGRIIQGMKNAKSRNPVFMLDEIDKIGEDYRGDPSAALLETLDPEQNSQFSDHYLEVPFDLSRVLFIATGNMIETVPPALRDRLEIIPFAGYIDNEKFHIAKNYLIPKQIDTNALDKGQIEFEDAAVKTIIRKYTREAGVRHLEREIAKVCRKVARRVTEGKKDKLTISEKNIAKFLGPRRFIDTIAEKKDEIGVSTGLAYTEAGGDILFIEVALMPGKGNLTLTGQLGDVMKESAQAAFSYVRSRHKILGLAPNFYNKLDIHIHVPEGAVPKDGPSAGIAIATALSSALTEKPVNRYIGMTGEITLRGNVLEIGGLKEKLVAAHRSGLKEIIIPKNNKKDLEEDVPKYVLRDLKFHFVETMDQVLPLAIKNFSKIKNGKK
jgi:ATP-dependent Lon protease